MTRDEIEAALHDILRRALGRLDLVLTDQTAASDVPGWDSVRQVVIILTVEEYFGITLRSREIDRLRHVGDFLELIRAKVAK